MLGSGCCSSLGKLTILCDMSVTSTENLASAEEVVPDGADASEAEMASRLRLAVTRLHRRLRQQTAGGLTQSQASALASIAKLGSPTLGALAASESVQPPSMTRVVGALEELGYVSRVIDPTDRRVARVTIRPRGHACPRAQPLGEERISRPAAAPHGAR